MRHSESLATLAAALTKALAEVENATKNAVNPAFKRDGTPSRYADLAQVIDTTKPVLTKHGLTVVQLPGFEAGVVTLESVLVHESGEWLSGVAGSPITKADPQGVGSAISYLRRYSLAALCGIAQEDDDGNAASRGNGRAVSAEKITTDQARTLDDLIEDVGADRERFLAFMGVASLADIPASKYAQAVAALESKRATVPA